MAAQHNKRCLASPVTEETHIKPVSSHFKPRDGTRQKPGAPGGAAPVDSRPAVPQNSDTASHGTPHCHTEASTRRTEGEQAYGKAPPPPPVPQWQAFPSRRAPRNQPPAKALVPLRSLPVTLLSTHTLWFVPGTGGTFSLRA